MNEMCHIQQYLAQNEYMCDCIDSVAQKAWGPFLLP
jgi:hypothetical protein